jgi:hypothetical protein
MRQGLLGFDQLGLVQTVDCLGERIVIGAADRPDRGLDACLDKPLAEPDRRILRSSIRMVDNIFEIQYTLLLAGPDGLLDGVEDHGGESASQERAAGQTYAVPRITTV